MSSSSSSTSIKRVFSKLSVAPSEKVEKVDQVDECLTNLGDLMQELDECFEHVEATEDADSLSRADMLIEDITKAIRDLRAALEEKRRIADPDILEVEDITEKVGSVLKQPSANSNGVVGKLKQVTLPKV